MEGWRYCFAIDIDKDSRRGEFPNCGSARSSDSAEGSKRPSISHVAILVVALSISVVPKEDININNREEGEKLDAA